MSHDGPRPRVPIRAFAFDLDETLVDCEVHHEEATAAMLLATGASAESVRDVFRACTGKRTRDLVDAFRIAANVPHTLDDLLKVRTVAFRHALTRTPPVFLPGAEETLRACAERGPVALVTSGHEGDAYATLDALGIRNLFTAVVTGEDVVNPKPHPEPYLMAAGRLNVDPRQMIAFEDSGRGVAAAKAAGMRVVAIPNPRNTSRDEVRAADVVLGSMAEALPLHRVLGYV